MCSSDLKKTKWRHIISQADNDDGVRKPRLIWQKQADKMEITRGKMKTVSFLHKIQNQETLLEFGFIFTQAWNGNKLCLKKWACPPALWLNSRYMPPKLQSICKADGVKVQITRPRDRFDWDFTRTYQRLELNRNVFHCFNEVDTLKELSSGNLVSWFKELCTRKGTLLREPGFIF